MSCFTENLKAARESAGMTQQQVADRLGITKSTYCGYETGKRKPDVFKLKEIAKVLNVSGSFLIGVEDLQQGRTQHAAFEAKKAPSLSDEAMEIAQGYETLDHWGKVAVRELLDTEKQRVEDEKQFRLDTPMDADPKVINLYAEPAAAGIATPTAGVDFEPYTLKPGDPQDAAYAVHIRGNSMSPAFPDGSMVFINHDAIRNGDIGIFCVNGGTVCKQYYRDPMGGVVILFSLNRTRADADVTVYPGSNETLICQGRVITKKKFPLPEGHL